MVTRAGQPLLPWCSLCETRHAGACAGTGRRVPQCELTDSGDACTEPAAARYAAMCVHEHLHTGLFCAAHELLALDGGWHCNDCREPVDVKVIEDFRAVASG